MLTYKKSNIGYFVLKNNYLSETGRSMVEMLGVLAIAGVLSIGGIWGYDRAARILRTNNLKDEISTMIANIRTLYYTTADYNGINIPILVSSGFIPNKYLIENNTKIINPLGGSVLVGSAETELKETGSFILVFNGLDAPTCREITALSWGSDMATGFLGMTVKNDGELTVESSNLVSKDFKTENFTYHANDLTYIKITDMYDACNCGNTNNCAVAWKFL